MREGFTFLPSPAYSIQQADSQAVAVKGKITKRSEGCEGEAFTLIIQVINELRTKSEEVKAKIENSLKRAHSPETHFLPKSAGISPHLLVSHFKMGFVTRCALSHASARAIIS